jgi:hypothetical protein
MNSHNRPKAVVHLLERIALKRTLTAGDEIIFPILYPAINAEKKTMSVSQLSPALIVSRATAF